MPRHLTNDVIARKLRDMAAFYEMDGVGFKPAAYERAAQAIDGLGDDAADIYKEKGINGLKGIDGVGEAIAGHIAGLLEKGTFPEYERFKKRYPMDVAALTSIEHVGPKTAKALYEKLGIRTLAELERAARGGKIRGIAGFGAKTEESIIKGVEFRKRQGDRKLLDEALGVAEKIEAALRKIKGVKHAVVAGSIRRRQETIGDVDVIVTTSSPEAVMREFASLPEVAKVLEHGETMTVALLKNGMHADVRCVPDDSFGAALQYFTGDKNHNVVVRKMAIAKGLKLNEYGIWRGKRRLASRTEEDVYKVLGLPYMAPEVRTASGEIEAALAGKLPKLIAYGSLKGDLQVQTDWTDGAASIAEMAEAARTLGHEYIAITDHTKSLAMTGLDEKRLARQAKEIDRLNAGYRKRGVRFRIFKGAEANILKDGSIDIDDPTLARLDFVGASVHSHFTLDRATQTARIARAMKNPHVDAIFHPTGRIIHEREAYDVDMDALLKTAKAMHTVMEIDAYPSRSDLKDVHARMAVALGVKLAIDSDAHHPSHLAYLDLGVAIARRGWTKTRDVINTMPLERIEAWLALPKPRRRG